MRFRAYLAVSADGYIADRDGVPMFPSGGRASELTLVRSQAYADGVVELVYGVAGRR